MTAKVNPALADVILDSLNDGLYVCNRDRRILYWNRAAERITGWSSEEVVGLRCMDNILDHKDKDGRRLCGEEFCPLHRLSLVALDSGSSGLCVVPGSDLLFPLLSGPDNVARMNGWAGGNICFFTFRVTHWYTLNRHARVQELWRTAHNVPVRSAVPLQTAESDERIASQKWFWHAL